MIDDVAKQLFKNYYSNVFEIVKALDAGQGRGGNTILKIYVTTFEFLSGSKPKKVADIRQGVMFSPSNAKLNEYVETTFRWLASLKYETELSVSKMHEIAIWNPPMKMWICSCRCFQSIHIIGAMLATAIAMVALTFAMTFLGNGSIGRAGCRGTLQKTESIAVE